MANFHIFCSQKYLFRLLIASILMTITSHAMPGKDDRTQGEETKVDLVRRKEKCEPIPYKQQIIVDGCKTVTIMNHYCRGQCISGYVPEENGVNGQYKCSSCQASTTVRKPVVLECVDNIKKIVDVEIFMGCKCMQAKCHVSDYNYRNFGSKVLGPTPAMPARVRPCRDICRRCRKAKREYNNLQEKKEQMEYLLKTCRLSDCKQRISDQIFGRFRMQKKLKKAVCKECKMCKKRKSRKANA